MTIKDLTLDEIKDALIHYKRRTEKAEAELNHLKLSVKEAMMHLAVNYDIDGNRMSKSDAYESLEKGIRRRE